MPSSPGGLQDLDSIQTIPLNLIPRSRYARVLNYPAHDDEQSATRLRELEATGVTAIRFIGPSMIDGVQILGKGCVGLVTQAVLEDRLVALKIRRADADRPSMYAEARLLRLANSVDVGPRLIIATKNFLVMELFDGMPLFRWADRDRGSNLVRNIVVKLLDSCFRLDGIGLDHGELSHAPKNVLVGGAGKTCIVDFETASATRRVANVTSLLQYFLFGSISKTLQTSKFFPHGRLILKALSLYKGEESVESYQNLLGSLGLRS